jgi:hypothetical protein
MTGAWDGEEEDEVAWRNRRRCAKSSAQSNFELASQRVDYNRCTDRFESNVTTSSVSSVRTKNTFLEVQDDLERLSFERIRSSRSKSVPPSGGMKKEFPSLEELQAQMASYYLDQLANLELQVPIETPAAAPAPNQSKSKRKNKKAANLEEGQTRSRLFVGGLSEETTDDGLYNHFSIYGDLIEASVILDKRSKHSRGFGFVAFRDGSVPAQVLTDDHVIDGTVVGVRVYGSEPQRAA